MIGISMMMKQLKKKNAGAARALSLGHHVRAQPRTVAGKHPVHVLTLGTFV